MHAKLTSKNRLTLPRRAIEAAGNTSHLPVFVDADRLVLAPSRPGAPDAVRQKLEALGLTESDVADALEWARA